MKYAHYFRSGKKHELIIRNGQGKTESWLQVAGKREARKIAKNLNAMPWNF